MTDSDPVVFKPISELMGFNQSFQRLDDQSSLQLADLARMVTDRRAEGKLVLEIVLKPEEGNSSAVDISGSIVLKEPKTPPARAIAFVGDHGTLHRDDPYDSGPLFEPSEPPRDYADHTGQSLTTDESGIVEMPDERD